LAVEKCRSLHLKRRLFPTAGQAKEDDSAHS
jgi:hypothetical protein